MNFMPWRLVISQKVVKVTFSAFILYFLCFPVDNCAKKPLLLPIPSITNPINAIYYRQCRHSYVWSILKIQRTSIRGARKNWFEINCGITIIWMNIESEYQNSLFMLSWIQQKVDKYYASWMSFIQAKMFWIFDFDASS